MRGMEGRHDIVVVFTALACSERKEGEVVHAFAEDNLPHVSDDWQGNIDVWLEDTMREGRLSVTFTLSASFEQAG